MNVKNKTYKKITPSKDGNVLTTYKDGDDILTYESALVMYVPYNFDTSEIREITKEEDTNYKNEKDLSIKRKPIKE